MSIDRILAKRQALVDAVAGHKAAFDETKQKLEVSQQALIAFDAKLEAALAGFDKPPTTAPKAKVAKKKVAKKKVAKKAKVKKRVGKKKIGKKKAKAKPKAVKTVTTQSKKNAAAGRAAVKRGERPPLLKAMKTVMGKRTMNAIQIVDALKAKKWLPNSSDHRQYISFMLSSNTPETFQRTSKRGFYKVRAAAKAAKAAKAKKGNGDAKAKAKKGNSGKAKKITKKTKKVAAKPKPKADPTLDQQIDNTWGSPGGDNVASDPHAEAKASAD